MSDNYLNRIEDVFHAVIELGPGDRETYLARVCDGDSTLYEEVSSLVAAFESKNEFFEQPAVGDAFKVITNSSEQSLNNKKVGQYQIVSLLGKGGMGEVYLAEDTKLNRKVALKFISPEFVGDTWARRRLFKEAQAAAQLDHPNICNVYGIEEYGEHIFIVMQYVEGETLADVIKQGNLTADHIEVLSTQIVSALAEAHSHGIIHRDVKPRNIMVTTQGTIKVLDFGLAKNVHQSLEVSEDSVSLYSKTGLVPGTIAYMSPEQLRGERLDYRSDIFSVGIVILEMITGENPYARGNLAETISAIVSNRPKQIVHAKSSRSLDALVSKCLETDPGKRFQSSHELLIDLANPRRSPRDRLSVSRLIPIFALLLIISIVVLFLINRKSSPVRIAVLPIANLTENSDNDYLSDGLTESLIQRLSMKSNLKVAGFTTVAGYKSYPTNVQIVGGNLNVDALLVGNMKKTGDALIVHVELLSVDDGSQLWSEQYRVDGSDLILAQSNIAQSVVARLGLNHEEKRAPSLSQTDNPEAFREYWTGRYYWKKRDKANVLKAIECFQKSIALDPSFALAYTGLADSYVVMTSVAYGSMPTRDAMTKAKAYAKQSLDINPDLAEAHTALGVIYLKYDWDWVSAESEFKKAISLNPDYAAAHYWYGELLPIVGRFEEAIRESEKAKELDPISPTASMAPGRAYYRARQFDRAIEYFKKALGEEPNNVGASYVLGYTYLKKSMYNEAASIFETAYTVAPTIGAAPLGFTYGKLRRKEDAQKVINRIAEISKEKNVPPIETAIIYIGLNDKDQAFSWLEKAYEERFAQVVYLNSDPIFDDLRSDPRFADLCRRINLSI